MCVYINSLFNNASRFFIDPLNKSHSYTNLAFATTVIAGVFTIGFIHVISATWRYFNCPDELNETHEKIIQIFKRLSNDVETTPSIKKETKPDSQIIVEEDKILNTSNELQEKIQDNEEGNKNEVETTPPIKKETNETKPYGQIIVEEDKTLNTSNELQEKIQENEEENKADAKTKTQNNFDFVYSDNSISFYVLKPGKPGSNEPWENGQLRPRVKQSPQKGLTCWYYAMNMLRRRLGKGSPPEYQNERQIEKLYSSVRKKVTSLLDQESFKSIANKIKIECLRDGVPTVFRLAELTPRQVNHILPEINFSKMQSHMQLEQSFVVSFQAVLENFSKQSSIVDFYDYLNSDYIRDYIIERKNIFYKKEIEISINFFKERGIRYEDMFENWKKKEILSEKYVTICNEEMCIVTTWSKIEFTQDVENRLNDLYINKMGNINPFHSDTFETKPQAHFLFHSLLSAAFQDYGFQEANWKPDNLIDILINTLTTHGPLLVSAHIGSKHGLNNRVMMNTMGRSIYGWQNESEMREEEDSSPHAVVITGAQKDEFGNEWVYFVDPNDGSDPENPELQKIYVYSYRNFKLIVQAFNNIPTKHLSAVELSVVSMKAYAFFHRNSKEEDMQSVTATTV